MDSLDINNEKTNKKQNNLVTFAKMNKYFLFPFLCPVFCMISTYFSNKILSSKVKIKEYLQLIYVSLSYSSTGILYLISYFKQEKNKVNDSYFNRLKLLKFFNNNKNNKDIKKNSIKKWLIIILIGILMLIYTIFNALFMDKHLVEQRLYFIFFIPLFSKIILKEEIYKHQYLSLIIAAIGIIIFIIPISLVFEQEDIIPNILIFVSGVSFSLCFALFNMLILHSICLLFLFVI